MSEIIYQTQHSMKCRDNITKPLGNKIFPDKGKYTPAMRSDRVYDNHGQYNQYETKLVSIGRLHDYQENKGAKKIISVALLITMMLSIISCSQKVPFLISSVVPSAEGSVKIKSDENNNYTIDLSVVRLVDPTRLTPPKVGYIVWMETENNGLKNIGQLKTSSGLMSSTLKSSLTTVTAFKPTSFFITGEDNLKTPYPGLVVLKTGTFR